MKKLNMMRQSVLEKGHGLFTYFLLKGIRNEDVVKPERPPL
jgi:hypothetical protein